MTSYCGSWLTPQRRQLAPPSWPLRSGPGPLEAPHCHSARPVLSAARVKVRLPFGHSLHRQGRRHPPLRGMQYRPCTTSKDRHLHRPPRRLPIPQRLRACSQVCDFVPGVGGRAHEVLTIAFHTGNVSFQTCNCCLDGLSSLFLHLCVSLAQLYLSCLRGALPHTA